MSYNAIAWMIGFGFAWSCMAGSLAVRVIAIILTFLLAALDIATSGGDEDE